MIGVQERREEIDSWSRKRRGSGGKEDGEREKGKES